MPVHRWITFLTDYGLENKFVGSCRSVLAAIAPDAQVIDITHLVPRGDVRHGALVLEQTAPFLPVGVHLAVVDPGVGTFRRAIAMSVEDHVFVGPDNGLLPWAVDRLGSVKAVHELAEPSFVLQPMSNTFHGRDLFSPFAARIASGVPVAEVGPELEVGSLVRLPAPVRRVEADHAVGEVLIVDRFGNLQTSIDEEMLAAIGAKPGATLEFTSRGCTHELRYCTTFASVAPGEVLCHIDSAGLLAIAVNLGDAADLLGRSTADQFTLRIVG